MGLDDKIVFEMDAFPNKIWNEASKDSVFDEDGYGEYTWDAPLYNWNHDFYLEGMQASAYEGDHKFRVTLHFNDQSLTSGFVYFTVVQINLGNAVYRECGMVEPGFAHSAIVTEYTGKCNLDDLRDPHNFKIVQMQGSGVETADNLDNITDDDGLAPIGCYHSAGTGTPLQRYAILDKVSQVVSRSSNISYCFFNVVRPEAWNESFIGLRELRCDGLIEVCYEYNNIFVWGKIVGGATHYDIKNDAFQQEHDEGYVGDWKRGLAPATQCVYLCSAYKGVYWNSTFVPQDLCIPVGHKGGN